MVHNHDIEFETVFGDQTVFDILMANTDPRNVVFQLDLYWATNGGGIENPLEVLERYGNRIQLFHVKDMAAGPFPGRIEIVGEGIIDFPEIFAAAGAGEVLRRRARPALRRPDVRPVRGGREGLRLPRLRDVLSAPARGASDARRPLAPRATLRSMHTSQGGDTCEQREYSLPSPACWRFGPCPSVAAAQAPPPDSQFQKVVIDDSPGEPMDLAVLPDGRVLHVTRQGHVWLHDPDTGLKTLAAQLDVYQHDEEGLQNIALDPNFEQNGWIYLYYSPPLDTPVDDPATPTVNEGDAPFFGTQADWDRFKGVIRLSRFQWDERTDTIDLGSEEQILDVPVDRGICCHVGGDIVFDGDGNLYLSTGDDTNPFESDGYTPIDEREGRNPAFDAQRTAANTNDLRGKILRITPTEGGGYTIPEGNLFAGQPTR